MAKVMIEVEIPAGRSIAEAKQAVAMKFDPDWITEHWHIDDVIEQAENNGEQLTIEEARWVLQMVDKNHDCEVGINWGVIDSWVDRVVEQREVV
jgi:hypothetical protein